MAVFTVECDGKLVKQSEAEEFVEKDQLIVFFDEQNASVGSAAKSP